MGKRYYCDYCERTFIDDIQARKKHLLGLKHTIRVKEHYQWFKDHKTILSEELAKAPCHRYQRTGECPFGINCRHSHYTSERLNELSQEVHHIEEAERAKSLEEQVKLNEKFSKDPGLPTWLKKKKCKIYSTGLRSEDGTKSEEEDNCTGIEDSELMYQLSGSQDFQNTLDMNLNHVPPSLRLMSPDDLLSMPLDSWEDWG